MNWHWIRKCLRLLTTNMNINESRRSDVSYTQVIQLSDSKMFVLTWTFFNNLKQKSNVSANFDIRRQDSIDCYWIFISHIITDIFQITCPQSHALFLDFLILKNNISITKPFAMDGVTCGTGSAYPPWARDHCSSR